MCRVPSSVIFFPVCFKWCAGKVKSEGEGKHEAKNAEYGSPHDQFEGPSNAIGGEAAEECQDREFDDASRDDVKPFRNPGKLRLTC